jgi:hypothetical protein
MPAARRALPRFCGWNQNRRTGKWRVRFRRGGFSCYLPMPDAPDFATAYAAAVADGAKPQARDIGAARTLTGSIDAVLVSYYRLVFPRLKPSTRAMRRNILERFRAKHGHKPVAQLERRHIDDMIAAMEKTPHAGNNLLKVLRHVLEHAIDINLIEANPALKVKKFKTTRRRHLHVDRGRGHSVRGASPGRLACASRDDVDALYRATTIRHRAHGLAARS